MAIILLKGGEKTYVSATGRVTDEEKARANCIFDELRDRLTNYESKAIEDGIIQPDGTRKDALKIWFEVGAILNTIDSLYKISGTSDEIYFWQSVYDHIPLLFQKLQPPQSSSGARNHFRRCAYMARRDWGSVKGVGNWSVWRDLLDNIRLQEDPRVFDWVVDNLCDSGLGHKEMRPFIHKVRYNLKGKDTSVLNDYELISKLEPLKALLYTKGPL